MDHNSPFTAQTTTSTNSSLLASAIKRKAALHRGSPLRQLSESEFNARAGDATLELSQIKFNPPPLKREISAPTTIPTKPNITRKDGLLSKRKSMPTMDEVLGRHKTHLDGPALIKASEQLTAIHNAPPIASFRVPDPSSSLCKQRNIVDIYSPNSKRARAREHAVPSSDATIPTDDLDVFVDSAGEEIPARLRLLIEASTSGSSSSEEDDEHSKAISHDSANVSPLASKSAQITKARSRSNSIVSNTSNASRLSQKSINRSRSNSLSRVQHTSHPSSNSGETVQGRKRRQTKKPDHPTYRAMIGIVLAFAPHPYCLNDIYEKVLEYWPTLRNEGLKGGDAGWKNSIRHNLSLNPEYEHKARPPDLPGKGDIWEILNEYKENHKQAAKEWWDKMQARGAVMVRDHDGVRVVSHPDIQVQGQQRPTVEASSSNPRPKVTNSSEAEKNSSSQPQQSKKRLRLDDDTKRRASTGSTTAAPISERKEKKAKKLKSSRSTTTLVEKDSNLLKTSKRTSSLTEQCLNGIPSQAEAFAMQGELHDVHIPPDVSLFRHIFTHDEDISPVKVHQDQQQGYNASITDFYRRPAALTPVYNQHHSNTLGGLTTQIHHQHSIFSSSPLPEVKYFPHASLLMTPPTTSTSESTGISISPTPPSHLARFTQTLETTLPFDWSLSPPQYIYRN